jgi:hypothetical protein
MRCGESESEGGSPSVGDCDCPLGYASALFASPLNTSFGEISERLCRLAYLLPLVVVVGVFLRLIDKLGNINQIEVTFHDAITVWSPTKSFRFKINHFNFNRLSIIENFT